MRTAVSLCETVLDVAKAKNSQINLDIAESICFSIALLAITYFSWLLVTLIPFFRPFHHFVLLRLVMCLLILYWSYSWIMRLSTRFFVFTPPFVHWKHADILFFILWLKICEGHQFSKAHHLCPDGISCRTLTSTLLFLLHWSIFLPGNSKLLFFFFLTRFSGMLPCAWKWPVSFFTVSFLNYTLHLLQPTNYSSFLLFFMVAYPVFLSFKNLTHHPHLFTDFDAAVRSSPNDIKDDLGPFSSIPSRRFHIKTPIFMQNTSDLHLDYMSPSLMDGQVMRRPNSALNHHIG